MHLKLNYFCGSEITYIRFLLTAGMGPVKSPKCRLLERTNIRVIRSEKIVSFPTYWNAIAET